MMVSGGEMTRIVIDAPSVVAYKKLVTVLLKLDDFFVSSIICLQANEIKRVKSKEVVLFSFMSSFDFQFLFFSF